MTPLQQKANMKRKINVSVHLIGSSLNPHEFVDVQALRLEKESDELSGHLSIDTRTNEGWRVSSSIDIELIDTIRINRP